MRLSTGTGTLESLIFRLVIGLGGLLVVSVIVFTTIIWSGLQNRQEKSAAYNPPLASLPIALDAAKEYCLNPSGEMYWGNLLIYGNIGRQGPSKLVDVLIEYPAAESSTRDKYDALRAAHGVFVTMGLAEESDVIIPDREGDLPILSGRGNNSTLDLRDLSETGYCSWTFGERPPPSFIKLLLIWLGLDRDPGFDSFREDNDYWDLFGDKAVQVGFLPAPLFLNAWRGTHHLTFTHSKALSSESEVLSIWIPRSDGAAFGQYVILRAMMIWSSLVLLLGLTTVWSITKPFRTVAGMTQKAGQIIAENKNVPHELHSLSERFSLRNDALRELKHLLNRTSSLFAEREQWIGNTLHHLKTDLEVINVSLNRLRKSAASRPAESLETGPLESIENASARICSVLDNVTVYQWALFGTPEKFTKIDLGSVLETIADDVEDMGGKISIEATSVNVEARKRAVESAMKNLVWNAYHHGSGMIQIRTKLTDEEQGVSMTIDDDGPGIDDDKIKELFKPYRQGGNQSSKKKFRGAGLGLAIAADVIAGHGGKLSVENRRNDDGHRTGCRVSVILPLTQDGRKIQDKKHQQ